MKIYIAGKITGLVYEDAIRAFCEAAALLERLGHEPVNPIKENGLDGDGNLYGWAEYMRRDIPHLLACDGIYLLSNWEDSKGARLEHHIASELRMRIIYEGFEAAAGIDVNSHCERCGKSLDNEGVCYYCKNSISSVSGVGIQTHLV